LLPLPLGSLDGLIALRQGVGNLAGCHLLDPEHDEYNLPYVRRLFPGQPMAVVTLAWREQGLLVQRGNPRAIRDLADLARPDVRWANRNRGSGTRVWLDRRLSRLSVPARRVRGYDQELSTHAEVASAVASGQADAGLAIRAAAQARDLDFIPLLKERYDLVLPAEACRDAATTPLLDELQTADFRRATEGLGGYDAADCGAVVLVTG
jgi:putative molybdopterin biosynthesis protein